MSWRGDVELTTAFVRNGGIARAVLVVGCTAVVSGLLLVAVTVTLLGAGDQRAEQLANLISDRGVRAGYVFALLLVCVAPLTLLRQVLRLGSAEREQRLAGLRLAGATPTDVHRLAALEVGLPALVGGLLGLPVFLAIRAVLGGQLYSEMARRDGAFYNSVRAELSLVPVSVSPAWWQVLLVVLAVGLAGAFAGASAARSVTVSPLGVARRTPRTAPRPWGLGLMALGVLAWAIGYRSSPGTPFEILFLGLFILGLLVLTPWIAFKVGTIVARRASQPQVLLAASRLAADPRPAGRAAAAIGAIGLIAGGGGVVVADLPASYGGRGFGEVEPIYSVPFALGGALLLLALALVVVTLAVHGAESLMDRRRAVASLAATGMTHAELERVQRWEIGLVALPVTVAGVLIGSVPLLVAVDPGITWWVALLVDAVTVVLAAVAVLLAARLTRPSLRRAARATNLRTG